MHFKDNQTLNLRVIHLIAGEGVWAIIDDGCNSCCHGEVRRQNAEANMKAFGLHPIWLHRKASTFIGVGTSTTSGKFENSHGHTTAGIRHGDTRVRAFT